MIRFDNVIPFLNVKNFAASVDYYVSKLGFEKEWGPRRTRETLVLSSEETPAYFSARAGLVSPVCG